MISICSNICVLFEVDRPLLSMERLMRSKQLLKLQLCFGFCNIKFLLIFSILGRTKRNFFNQQNIIKWVLIVYSYCISSVWLNQTRLVLAKRNAEQIWIEGNSIDSWRHWLIDSILRCSMVVRIYGRQTCNRHWFDKLKICIHENEWTYVYDANFHRTHTHTYSH